MGLVSVPVTRTRLSHALTIRAGGRIIGAVHQWSPSQTRTIDTEFEIGPNEVGMPREVIPQTVETRSIRIARYDLYPILMEEAFGSREIVNLSDQSRPFTLREVWTAPGAGLGLFANIFGATVNRGLGRLTSGLGPDVSVEPVSLKQGITATAEALLSGNSPRQYEFLGCWFSDIGRNMDAKGDRIISVDATIVYLTKRRII